jgi:hypothetical protein
MPIFLKTLADAGLFAKWLAKMRPACLRGMTLSPVRPPDPVAEFGTTMVRLDQQSYPTAQRVPLLTDLAPRIALVSTLLPGKKEYMGGQDEQQLEVFG